MLPFLKNRDDGVGVGPVPESIERKPDDGADLDMLSAVAEDLFTAIEKKDKKLFKEALEAFCSYVQEMDEEQDQEMAE